MATNNALEGYIDRLERLLEERAGLNADMGEIYQEAKDAGYQPKLMREIIRERAMEPDARAERESMLNLYRNQLGMLADLPLGEAAMKSAAEAPLAGRKGGKSKRGKQAETAADAVDEGAEGLADPTPITSGRKKAAPVATGTGHSHGAGAEAAEKGRPRDENPHPEGTMSHAEWDAGWLSAKQPAGEPAAEAAVA